MTAVDARALPSITPDWDAARQRAESLPWAGRILQQVREDFTWWRSRLVIPGPGADTEWTHHYFCDDGNRLRFDPQRPRHHVCPGCGEVRAGDLLDGAWRTQMHNAAASQAQRAVLLLRLGDDGAEREEAREALLGILEHYAREYPRYREHGDKVGTGRVMPQSLDEAIWAIALLRAVRWGGELLPDRALDAAGALAEQVAALLEPQLGMVHNIHCWIIAALAECGVRRGDHRLLERIRRGPFGVETQIRDGIREEGIWYETSAFYHYYALAALLSYREATGTEGLSAAHAEVLSRAVDAPSALAYSDGLLPAYGDCWPYGRLEDFAAQVAVAAAVVPERPVVGRGFRGDPERTAPVDLWIGSRWANEGSRPLRGPASVAELVFGRGPLEHAATPERGVSFLWPDTGIGTLVSDRARVTMRFGRDVGMHDHRDRLAVDVELPGGWRSLDLGSGGYTAEATRWMQSPAAHSIGTLHDQRQGPADGVLRAWSPEHVSAEVSWSEGRIRRSLRLTPEGWTDEMDLHGDRSGPLMWIFHGDGTVLAEADDAGTEGGSMPSSALGTLPGLQHLRDVRRLRPDRDGEVTLRWDRPGAPVASVTVPPGAVCAAAVADGNPSGHPLGIVLVRVHAQDAHVSARFVVPPASRDPEPPSVPTAPPDPSAPSASEHPSAPRTTVVP